ncbi:MAG: site-specific integrase [Ruminococcus sp.]
MPIDRTACPEFLNDYILYLSMSKSLSPRTVEEYYLDIRLFLQYILMMKDKQYVKLDEMDMQKISIVDFQFHYWIPSSFRIYMSFILCDRIP